MRITKLNDLIVDAETQKGRWKLTDKHELAYRVRGEDRDITVSQNLIAAESGTLVFAVTEKQNKGTRTSLLKLAGQWRVGRKNRLVFDVKKAHGKKDSLVLQGTWELGPAHQIVYTYKRESPASSKPGPRQIQKLVIKGYWGISARNRLTYYVGASEDAALTFRGSLQTHSILAQKGEIRYQIGIELNGKPAVKTIKLFGKWKISNLAALSFDVAYGNRKYPDITFGAALKGFSGTDIRLNLKTPGGKPLGVEFTMNRTFFGKDNQFFVRLLKSARESAAEAGVRLEW